MKNIYEYFFSSLPESYQKKVDSFIDDCQKIRPVENCIHIINKNTLSGSNLIDKKILNLHFNNVDCGIYINVYRGDEENPSYNRGVVSFTLIKSIHKQKKLKIYFESEIAYKNYDDRYSIEISIQDNNNNELFKTSFREYINKIFINKKKSDSLKEKSNSGLLIGNNQLVMRTLLQNFQNPENLIDTIFLLTDVEVKDNYFIQELSKASLLIKYNQKTL